MWRPDCRCSSIFRSRSRHRLSINRSLPCSRSRGSISQDLWIWTPPCFSFRCGQPVRARWQQAAGSTNGGWSPGYADRRLKLGKNCALAACERCAVESQTDAAEPLGILKLVDGGGQQRWRWRWRRRRREGRRRRRGGEPWAAAVEEGGALRPRALGTGGCVPSCASFPPALIPAPLCGGSARPDDRLPPAPASQRRQHG